MKVIPKPKIKKSRPGKIHVGVPIPEKGWKLRCKWIIIAIRGEGANFQKVTQRAKDYEEAKVARAALMKKHWSFVEIRQVELLTPIAKK